MSGVIAIVGRPNVGKSAIFNRIVGRRIAIVHDQPGVTRDRVSAEAEWKGHPFSLIDTGGIGLLRREKAPDVITQAAIYQVELAIAAAHVILLVVDVQQGAVPLDLEVAARLRESGKTILVVINKVDHPHAEAGLAEFERLGFPNLFPVSAIHGLGFEALLDQALTYLPPEAAPAQVPAEADPDAPPAEAPPAVAEPFKLAIVGRPNVGKSSIINALTQSERVIVSPIPGTTRDAIDVPFEIDTEGVRQRYTLIDTAGVRKEGRVHDSIEFYSIRRTDETIERCDLVVLMLDAESGVLEQDKKIADKIVRARKACLVVVNKWDLVSDAVTQARRDEIARRRKGDRHRDDRQAPQTTLSEFAQWVQETLFFLDYAPVIFTSATEGFHLDRLLEAVRYVAAQLQQKIPTAILNRTLQDAIERRQPVSSGGHRLKFYYATQVQKAPPTFLLFVNRDDLFTPAYHKYLAGELRTAFGYEGCPLILIPRSRPKTIESVRRSATHAQAQRQPTTRRKRDPKSVRAKTSRGSRAARPKTRRS